MEQNEEPEARVVLRRVHPDARVPERQTPGASGWDLRVIEGARIQPGFPVVLRTGLAVSGMPPGWEIQVRSRSGLAIKHDLSVTHGIGTVDSDYRGEILVLIANHGKLEQVVKPGDRVAQLVVARVPRTKIVVDDAAAVTESERGEGGFGSTGVR